MTDTKWRIGKAFAKYSKAARKGSPEAAGRVPLLIGSAPCGSVMSEDAKAIAAAVAAFALKGGALVLEDAGMDEAARSATLEAAAAVLRQIGRIGEPRGEMLEVREKFAQPRLALLDRSAFRAMGLLTLAVHMIGIAADGRMWTCRRALTKSVNPGRWDSLAAGLVAAGEEPLDAMRREAHEEAGIEAGRDYELAPYCRFFSSCEAGEAGWLREASYCYCAHLKEGVSPRNLDGEVCEMQLLDADQMAELVARGLVTREASLAALAWLAEKTGKALPEGFYQKLG